MMETKSLRKKLLDLAIQGKLIPQNPADEPASALLQRIEEERRCLIRTGKMRKPKSTSYIFKRDGHFYEVTNGKNEECIDDQIPFDIPDSWEWVRGVHILMETTNKEPDSNFVYIDIDAINNKRHLITTPKHIRASDAPIRARRKLQEGDTLFSLVRPYLENVAYVSAEFSGAIASTGFFVIRPEKAIDRLYVFHMFLSPYVVQGLNNYMKGDNSPSIRGEHIWSFLLPIPPLREQHRIVEKLDSYISQIDRIEGYKAAMDKDFRSVRSRILELAVRGKLVPQDPSDEPASVLLKRVAAERAKLGKEGGKPASRIVRRDGKTYEIFPNGTERDISTEVLFEIPDSWEWCRLGYVFQHNTGKALNSSNRTGVKLSYITTSNLYWDRFELDSVKEMWFEESEIEKCTVRKDDLLVCEGGDFGRAAIWRSSEPIRIQNHIHRLRSCGPVCIRFYYYVFYCYKLAKFIEGNGIGIQGLSSGRLHSMLIPLPPLQEQHRIVKKLDILLKLVDDTK